MKVTFCHRSFMADEDFDLARSLTFAADLDSAGGSDLVSILVPLPSNLLQGDLAHENGILVFLDVKVLQILHQLQLMFCDVRKKPACRLSVDKSYNILVKSYHKPPAYRKC